MALKPAAMRGKVVRSRVAVVDREIGEIGRPTLREQAASRDGIYVFDYTFRDRVEADADSHTPGPSTRRRAFLEVVAALFGSHG